MSMEKKERPAAVEIVIKKVFQTYGPPEFVRITIDGREARGFSAVDKIAWGEVTEWTLSDAQVERLEREAPDREDSDGFVGGLAP